MRARYPAGDEAEARLRRNGFVVLDDIARLTLDQAYPAHGRDPHVFVTTDALLALWYGLHRRLLTDAEANVLAPRLSKLVPALLNANTTLLRQPGGETSRAALRRAALLLAVAERLLNEQSSAPPDIAPQAEQITDRVRAHRDMEAYPGEDFTQYVVRGHYADSPALSRYFQASLWLSRQFQSVALAPGPDPDAPLQNVVALAAVLRAAPAARASLRSLNAARQALAGPPNATTVEQVIGALDRTLGRAWTLDQAVQPAALSALRGELGQARYPRTRVQTRPVWPDTPFPRQVVALLPDSALPDSALFQDTVNPRVPGRSLPTGLEVGAALGFDVARALLRTSDPQAGAVLAAIGRQTPFVAAGDRSLYGGWLRTLATLHRVDPRAPQFMRGDSWQCEKLNTALASWAQARHTYALYGAQSYAQLKGLEMPVPGLVEANPAFYHSLAALTSDTRRTLARVKALTPPDAANLEALETQCRAFAADAEAELSGTLSTDRSAAIADFGGWLEQFQLQTGPLVADVATGMQGEVRHVATGGFNPLLVIPDPKNGTAYVGWTLSYYEFTRPVGDRLTDARWQQRLAGTLLRPERPAWSKEFVFQARGPEWQSREPLRQAETLFQAGQNDEAMVLLRRTVADNPDTTLATEAQCRLGQFYEDAKDVAGAIAEYLKCRRLPGGDAADIAHRARFVAGFPEQQWAERRATLPGARAATEARAVLDALKTPGLAAAERAGAGTAVGRGPGPREHGQACCPKPSPPAARRNCAKCCVTCCVMAPMRDNAPDTTRAAWVPGLRTFARTACSPALKAAALCKAAELAIWPTPPTRLIATLSPYLSPKSFARDPSYVFLTRALGRERPSSDIDPKEIVEIEAMMVRSQVVTAAYEAGRLEDMARYYHALPPLNGGHDDADTFMEMYRRYPEFDHKPLSLYARAWAQGNKSSQNAPNLYREVAEKYPASPLAAPALQAAESLLREGHQTSRADEVRALILQNYGGTAIGLFYKAQMALERDDLDQAGQLLDRAMAVNKKHPSEFSETLNYGIGQGLRFQIEQTQRLRRALRPLAVAAGRPDAAHVPPSDVVGADPVALAERLAAALPSQAVPLYDALRQLYPSVSLSLRSLSLEPDGPRAAALWHELVSNEASLGYEAEIPATDLDLLIPLVDRGLDYPYSAPALALFQRALGRNQDSRGEGWRVIVENAKLLAGRNAETRVAEAALGIAARMLLENGRPEDAQALLQTVAESLPEADPVRAEADLLRRRAAREIWAKHRPEWNPIWQAQVGPKGNVTIGQYPPPQGMCVTQGIVVVLWAGGVVDEDDNFTGGLAGRGRLGRRHRASALGGYRGPSQGRGGGRNGPRLRGQCGGGIGGPARRRRAGAVPQAHPGTARKSELVQLRLRLRPGRRHSRGRL